MTDPMAPQTFLVRAGVGAETQQPHVSLRYGTFHLKLDPDTARQLAVLILQAADTAELEAQLFAWTQTTAESAEQAMRFLQAFRDWRAQRTNAAGGNGS